MKRRWFAVLGVLFVALVAAFLAEFGLPPRSDLRGWVQLGLCLLAASLYVVGGLRERGGPLAWYRFVGAGTVALALMQLSRSLYPVVNAEARGPFFGLSLLLVVGSLALGFLGVDQFLGGRNLDLSRFDSGPILGS